MGTHFPIVYLVVLLVLGCLGDSFASDPDQTRNVTELIKAKGYPEEEHIIVTPDGFKLSVQRITGPKGSTPTNTSKPVVLLQHGLEDNAISWVILETNESLGFILADRGYDVWMSNARGNYYSTAHETLTPKDPEFWAWSLDEMAKYDLPSVINYILSITKQKQLSYIGHSQGTIMGFAGFSNPQIASKVNIFVALAPVAYVHNSKSPLLTVLAALDVEELFVLFGIHDFTPDTPLIQKLLPAICKADVYLCTNVLGLLCGWDTRNLNKTRLPVIMGHEPSGTSVQNIAHWAQLVNKEEFGMFDYGSKEKNMQHYNQTSPPQYDLGAVNVPVALFYGDNDILADPIDVKRLLGSLKTVVYANDQPTYAHLDFTWGVNAHTLIYPLVLNILQKYATLN